MKDIKNKQQKSGGWKRALIEWAVMLSIFGFIYLMGWHTEVIGRLQQGLLWTGLIQADTELTDDQRAVIDYDMPLITFSGKAAYLEEFKGQVIFLNFWATWCPPCIAEMPGIQSVYEEYSGRNEIAFVMISLDEDITKARQFLEDRDYTFTGYRLNGIRPELFRSEIIPTTYVINKKGVLVAKKEGMANYNTSRFRDFLEDLLQE